MDESCRQAGIVGPRRGLKIAQRKAQPATSLGTDAEVVEAGETDNTDATQPDLSGLTLLIWDGIAHQWALSQVAAAALAGAAALYAAHRCQ